MKPKITTIYISEHLINENTNQKLTKMEINSKDFIHYIPVDGIEVLTKTGKGEYEAIYTNGAIKTWKWTEEGYISVTKKESDFTQLCVWPGTVVGEDKIKEFEKWMSDEFNGTRILYEAEVLTNPDKVNGIPVPETGGRNDLFFYIHSEDIGKFAIVRLAYGIRWWEDVLGNGGAYLYSEEFLKKHPKTW